MGIWVLILFAHSGVFSSKDSMSFTNIPGFTTKTSCETAGKISADLVKGTIKDLKYVCVEQK